MTKKSGNGMKKRRLVINGVFSAVAELAVGFVFGSFGPGEVMVPFGAAYCSVCGIWGLAGAVLGCFYGGLDVWRYVIACGVAFFSRKLLSSHIKIGRHIKSVLFCTWSMLIAGICGLFISSYGMREDLYFVLCAPVAAVSAYVLSVTYEIKNGKTVPTRLKYVCFTVSAAMLLVSAADMGVIWENVALTLMFFFMICLIRNSGLYYVSTTAAVFSLGLYIYSKDYSHIFWVLLLGTVTAALTEVWGRYAVVLSYLISNAVVGLIFPSAPGVWVLLFDIAAAGVIYVLLPEKTVLKLAGRFSPFAIKKTYVSVKRDPYSVRSKYSVSHMPKAKKPSDICKRCKRRLLCWIKDYSYTADVFDKLSRRIGDPDFEIPPSFIRKCVSPEAVISLCRREFEARNDGKVFSVDVVRTSSAKNGETDCGDSDDYFISEDKKCVICLADGMGSGKRAAEQSSLATGILKSLIRNGIGRDDALSVVNDLLLSEKSETVMGIDMTVIDLINGKCELVKANAAPTFILRGKNVFVLSGPSFPIGLSSTPELSEKRCTLLDGDTVVMVSDGFIAAGTSDLADRMRAQVRVSSEGLALAGDLMAFARENKLDLGDDLTVIVANLKASA